MRKTGLKQQNEEFEETGEEICKIEKQKQKQKHTHIVTGWEMQETIEEKWKSELEEKSENNSINRNKQKCGKTRRELYGAMAYNLDYIGLLIYISDKQWRIALIKKYVTIVRSGAHSLLATWVHEKKRQAHWTALLILAP